MVACTHGVMLLHLARGRESTTPRTRVSTLESNTGFTGWTLVVSSTLRSGAALVSITGHTVRTAAVSRTFWGNLAHGIVSTRVGITRTRGYLCTSCIRIA
uniref:Uncharacterized protein n=1 Tax=Cacopsylla melanoneura TaxID=428564 RepID=A0A8D8LCL0_9HEMI